jgi:hypothetical protein
VSRRNGLSARDGDQRDEAAAGKDDQQNKHLIYTEQKSEIHKHFVTPRTATSSNKRWDHGVSKPFANQNHFESNLRLVWYQSHLKLQRAIVDPGPSNPTPLRFSFLNRLSSFCAS